MNLSFSLHAQEEKKRDHFYLEVGIGTGFSIISAREALGTTGFNNPTGINMGLRLFEFTNHLILLESGLNNLYVQSDLVTHDGKLNTLSIDRWMIPLRLQWQAQGKFAPHFSLSGYYSFDEYTLSTFPETEFLMANERRNTILWGFSGGFVYNIPETRNQFKLTVSNIIDPNQRTAYGISNINTSLIFSVSRYFF